MKYIKWCGAHKHYLKFAVINIYGEFYLDARFNHERGAICWFFCHFPRGTPVVLGSIGN